MYVLALPLARSYYCALWPGALRPNQLPKSGADTSVLKIPRSLSELHSCALGSFPHRGAGEDPPRPAASSVSPA